MVVEIVKTPLDDSILSKRVRHSYKIWMNKTHQSIKDQRQKRSALSDLHLLSWSLEGANVHFCYGLPAAVVLERISRKKNIATYCNSMHSLNINPAIWSRKKRKSNQTIIRLKCIACKSQIKLLLQEMKNKHFWNRKYKCFERKS